ncbi:MAG: hypothetical protein ACRDL7_10470, partial [Gaiellaceae bacterium]
MPTRTGKGVERADRPRDFEARRVWHDARGGEAAFNRFDSCDLIPHSATVRCSGLTRVGGCGFLLLGILVLWN